LQFLHSLVLRASLRALPKPRRCRGALQGGPTAQQQLNCLRLRFARHQQPKIPLTLTLSHKGRGDWPCMNVQGADGERCAPKLGCAPELACVGQCGECAKRSRHAEQVPSPAKRGVRRSFQEGPVDLPAAERAHVMFRAHWAGMVRVGADGLSDTHETHTRLKRVPNTKRHWHNAPAERCSVAVAVDVRGPRWSAPQAPIRLGRARREARRTRRRGARAPNG
jgi:hypothetical protein